MRILIDRGSGCCNGVGRAISTAEQYLSGHDRLYSLGAIVHNDAEIQRLAGLGLHTAESRRPPMPWPAKPECHS